jgi:hypothetical protein
MGYFQRWRISKEWIEEDHPRHPPGSPEGGQFAAKELAAAAGRELVGTPGNQRRFFMGSREERSKRGDIVMVNDRPHLVVLAEKPRRVTEDEIEDLDAWSEYPRGPGWYQVVTLQEVAMLPAEKQRAAVKDTAQQAHDFLEEIMRTNYKSDKWHRVPEREASERGLPREFLSRLRVNEMTNSGADLDRGTLTVTADEVWFYHGGSYDDYRASAAVSRDPEIRRQALDLITRVDAFAVVEERGVKQLSAAVAERGRAPARRRVTLQRLG